MAGMYVFMEDEISRKIIIVDVKFFAKNNQLILKRCWKPLPRLKTK